ncbi:uncharacterized protein LOC141858446 [Brevipalpus obovatus]|uniref:uncharacterized protein LOC141858446 n=1 Tax=Brevipalpus obovatus TaxID=246614 RepID=UPI003D9F6BD0
MKFLLASVVTIITISCFVQAVEEEKINIFNNDNWDSNRFSKFLKDSYTQIPGAVGEILGKIKIPKTNIFNDANWDAEKTMKLVTDNLKSVSTNTQKAFNDAVTKWDKNNPVEGKKN